MKTANSDIAIYLSSPQLWDKYFAEHLSISAAQLLPLLAEINCNVQVYHRKKLALYHYDKVWAQLSDADRAKVEVLVLKQLDIENAVLNSNEAQQVGIQRQHIIQAHNYIFTDNEHTEFKCCDDFKVLLLHDQLEPLGLFWSLVQQFAIEQVMDHVCRLITPISKQDGYLYYLNHPDKFTQPEYRTVSHILITINEQLAENTYHKSLQRATLLVEQLTQSPQLFAQLARQYSECPTALNAGLLGKVKNGTLYPELDAVLFSMQSGQISQIVQSEIGFHILYCQSIVPEKLLSFDRVAEALMLQLTAQAVKRKQQQWLRKIFHLAAASVPIGDVVQR